MSRLRTAALLARRSASLLLLECAIALILAGYFSYKLHEPASQFLGRLVSSHHAGVIAAVMIALIALPLLAWGMFAAVATLTRRWPRVPRTVFDLLALTVLITLLAQPALQPQAGSPAQFQQTRTDAAHALATGPLNSAPTPLKMQRIPLGAEIVNEGSQALEVGVFFVTFGDRGRSYCAGRELDSGNRGRSRIDPGQTRIYTSGNCQYGHVALTVWSTTGQHLYQTQAIEARN